MKEQIIESEKKLLTAFQSNDTTILDELLHDDLLFVIPTGQTITKAMDLENMRSGNMTVHSISSSDQQINLIGDNAIVSVLIELKGKYLEHNIDGKFRYIRVWKLINDTWKVIGGSGMQI
ncbi:MAG TPA: nuclear transport factor 2 family protein [Bacteroidia bacterium]|jgi:ketosteroid isomerase-like protein|nr:nuclear transport factor 2 family protein [Bacteroidia bacterium]